MKPKKIILHIKIGFRKLLLVLTAFHRQTKITRVCLTLFGIYIILFDEYSMVQRVRNSFKIRAINQEINYYKGVIEDNEQKTNELNSSKENLEKFAREQFYMKKRDEDIFVINPNK